MADPFYLKVMGTPELLDPFGRRVRFKVRKHLALLIYLTLERARPAFRRDHLVELLWPRSNGKGGQSLSMGFSVLRAIFGAECIRGKKDIAQFTGPAIVTDLQRLESRELFGTEIDPPLEVDGLLREFDIVDAPGFQHWLDGKRAEFLPAIKTALAAFIDRARRSGDAGAMTVFAERLLGLDQLADEGVIARMESLALQGDRLGALRLYERWKGDLHRELQAAPSVEVEALAARLRKRSLALATNPAAAIVEQYGERPFVGRAAEYRVLFEAWETTRRSKSTHVLLTGESGIGKSTLAMRFGSMASFAGAAVARVQCFELEQRIAFGMMGALITELLDRPGVTGTAPASLAEVARIVAKVRERFPNLPPAMNTEGEAARLHFAEGTFAMFDAIMEEQPLILIVDDYPRSDEVSLSVLHLLLRRSENHRLMVILSGRPPSPEDPPQAARIRRAVAHLAVRRIDLPALSEGEAEELLRMIFHEAGKIPGAPERRAILRTAAGNPMALELLSRDWVTHPSAPLALLLTAMRSDFSGAALVAEDYDQFIERIVPSLSPRHRIALYLAVILGPRLNDFQYFKCLDLSVGQIMAALSELVERRILRSTDQRLEFTNEVMRARIYLKIPASTRVRLHDSVATQLLEAIGNGDVIPGLEVAWHCIRAKRRDEAAPFLISGSRQSIASGAPDEAARALASALRELKGTIWQEASLLLAESYHEMGDAKAILETVDELRGGKPTDVRILEMCDELELGARNQLGLIQGSEAASCVRSFIESYRNRVTPAAQAQAAFSSASIAGVIRDMGLIGDLQVALEEMKQADFEAREQALVLAAKAMTAFHCRDNATSSEALDLACGLFETSGNQNATLASLRIGIGVIAIAEGRYLDALDPLERAHALAKRLGNEWLQMVSSGNLSTVMYRLGNYSSQLTWAQTARKCEPDKVGTHGLGRNDGLRFERIRASGLWGLAAANLRKDREAEEAFVSVSRETQGCSLRWVTDWGKFFQADILWLLGRESEALKEAVEAGATQSSPATLALTGTYSRWSAILAQKNHTHKAQLTTLVELRRTATRLDALDRAELDCAIALLCRLLGKGHRAAEVRAKQSLASIPEPCAQQMTRLGLLSPDR